MVPVFVLSFLLLINGGNAAQCGGPNRITCRNIYEATKCSVLDECVQLWRSSVWEKYKNDTSSSCTVCRALAKSLPVSQIDTLCKIVGSENEVQCYSALGDLTKKLGLSSSSVLQDQRDVDILCNTLSACETDVYLGNLDFGSVICDDCKKVISNIRQLVADNSTADAIIEELNSLVCDNLSEHVRDYCKKTVEVHVPIVLHLIEIHISPDDICALLGLCPKPAHLSLTLNQLLPRHMRRQLAPTSPSNLQLCSGRVAYSWINRPVTREGYYMFTSYGPLNVQRISPSPSCEQCMAVVQKMKDSIQDPAFRNEIKHGLENEVCSSLGYLAVICKKAIDEHFDELVKDIENLDVQKACTVFKMCDKTMGSSVIMQTQLQPSVQLPVVCQLCEVIVEKVIDIVVDKPTEASITAALDQICSLVPLVYKKRCDNFVANFGAKIVEAIIKGTAPKLACTSVGLCTGPFMHTMVQPYVPTVPTGSSYCSTCKVLVNVVYREVNRNETEDELKKLVKSVCSILPGSYETECDNLVDEYLSVVVQYLEESMSPEDVCEKIGFCPEEAGVNQAICLRGPSYWCLNRETAERCNATAICSTQRPNTMMTFGPGTRRDCIGRDRAEICASLEWAAACGLTRECLEHRLMNYVQTMTHIIRMKPLIPTGNQVNCTICGQLAKRWVLQRKFLGSPFLSNEPCLIYKNEEDRAQCNLVTSKRYLLLREVMRTDADPEMVCKRMHLCRKPTVRTVQSPCLEDPLYAISSRRAAEMCGTLDIYSEMEAMNNDRRTSTTNVPPSTSPVVNRAGSPNSDLCGWGPSHWCLSFNNAQRCGQVALEHCQTKVWHANRPADESGQSKPLLGNVRCSWGPSYWCSNLSNAQSCGDSAVNYCRQLGMFA